MKKNLLLIILISIMCFTLNVNAANTIAKEGDTEFNTLKTQYNKGIQKTSINGTGIVTLYGYSSCDSSGCTYKYSNTSSDYKEVLKSSVKCTGGEKYIIYQTTGGADGYKESNSANYTGEAYWSEDFSVTCTNTQSSSTITLSNTGGTSSGGSSSGGTSGSTSSSSGSTGSEYNSSTTTESKETGVETYYIVLGTVGIITYAVMRIVKKQNLFKNI